MGKEAWEWSTILGGWGLDTISGLTKLVLDADNNPNILVTQNLSTGCFIVRSVCKIDNYWQFRFVDIDKIGYQLLDADLAVDKKNNIHAAVVKKRGANNSGISYFIQRSDYTGLQFANDNSEVYSTAVVTIPSGNRQMDEPIVFFGIHTPSPKILIYRTNPNDATSSITELPDSDSSFDAISAVTDSRGQIHVVTHDSSKNTAKYFVLNGNLWTPDYVNCSIGSSPKIAVDSMGTPHIISLTNETNGYREITYSIKREKIWNNETVAKVNNSQTYFALATDAKNRPNLLHSDVDNSSLFLSIKKSRGWVTEKLFDYDYKNMASPVDIAIGSDDLVRIVSVFNKKTPIINQTPISQVLYGSRKAD